MAKKKKKKGRFRIEVSKVCTATSREGNVVNITEPMLQDMAATYNPDTHVSPFVLGHPKHDDPAYGWAASMEYDENEKKLYAIGDPDKIDDELKAKVEKGDYKKISLSMYPPTAANNPSPGHWYPKHYALLGGASPAVTNMADASFDPVMDFCEDADVIEFSYAVEQTLEHTLPGIFRNLREWMIDKFSTEEADKVLPNWEIKDIERSASQEREQNSKTETETPSSFSENQDEVNMTLEQIEAMQAENARLIKESGVKDATISAFQNEKSTSRSAEVKQFCDALVEDNQALPAVAKNIGELLNALDDNSETGVFSFSDGSDSPSKANALMGIIKQVAKHSFDFSEKGHEPNTTKSVHSFTTPEGTTVDMDRESLHNEANDIVTNSKGNVTYVQAVAQLERAL